MLLVEHHPVIAQRGPAISVVIDDPMFAPGAGKKTRPSGRVRE